MGTAFNRLDRLMESVIHELEDWEEPQIAEVIKLFKWPTDAHGVKETIPCVYAAG